MISLNSIADRVSNRLGTKACVAERRPGACWHRSAKRPRRIDEWEI